MFTILKLTKVTFIGSKLADFFLLRAFLYLTELGLLEKLWWWLVFLWGGTCTFTTLLGPFFKFEEEFFLKVKVPPIFSPILCSKEVANGKLGTLLATDNWAGKDLNPEFPELIFKVGIHDFARKYFLEKGTSLHVIY